MKGMILLKQAVDTFVISAKKETYKNLAGQALVALCGFVASRGTVMSNLCPFGIGACSGVSSEYMVAASIGAVIGYVFPAAGQSGFKYISAVLSILMIRILLKGIKKVENSPVFLSILSFLTPLSIFITVNIGTGIVWPKILAETALISASTFFISKSFKIDINSKPGLVTEEIVSVCFVMSVIIMGLLPFSVDDVSFGRILSILFVLIASRFGGASMGTLSGVIVSFVIFISGDNYAFYIPILSLGGLFSGFFSNTGKLASVIGFLVTAVLSLLITGNLPYISAIIIEIFIASGIFLLLPKNLSAKLSNIFLGKAEIPELEGAKGALCMKLRYAAEALQDVNCTIDEVSKELSRINSPDFDTVLKRVEECACKNCSLCVHCWEVQRSETVEAVLGISSTLKQNDREIKENVPSNFLARCLRFDRFKSAVIANYSDYISKINAENRIEEVRGIISDHFGGISNMLYDLSNEFKYTNNLDENATEKIITALRHLNIPVTECAATTDKFNRLSADIKVKLEKDTILNKIEILSRLENACDKNFDPPCITKTGNEAFISITEKTVYYCDVGVTQISANQNSMCGDSYDYFIDGKGHLVMIISDGMGNGGRAAVDSSMVTGLMSRLIKSGFGYDCSLKIANSSMVFKSTDESLATVDISVIDLFSGETDLFKAGAAPTLVRKKGRTSRAVSRSLPAGILREIGFDKATVKLNKNDIVLMMSDGVINEGTDWICAFLEDFDGTAQELADLIASAAKRRRCDNHEDDITVLAAIINKAN